MDASFVLADARIIIHSSVEYCVTIQENDKYIYSADVKNVKGRMNGQSTKDF